MLKLFTLANPSDPYTFYAPNIVVAGVVAYLLSSNYGAVSVDDPEQRSPVMFGWDAWAAKHGIDETWSVDNQVHVINAMQTLLYGHPNERPQLENLQQSMPESQRLSWRRNYNAERSGSVQEIGESAYRMAELLMDSLNANN